MKKETSTDGLIKQFVGDPWERLTQALFQNSSADKYLLLITLIPVNASLIRKSLNLSRSSLSVLRVYSKEQLSKIISTFPTFLENLPVQFSPIIIDGFPYDHECLETLHKSWIKAEANSPSSFRKIVLLSDEKLDAPFLEVFKVSKEAENSSNNDNLGCALEELKTALKEDHYSQKDIISEGAT